MRSLAEGKSRLERGRPTGLNEGSASAAFLKCENYRKKHNVVKSFKSIALKIPIYHVCIKLYKTHFGKKAINVQPPLFFARCLFGINSKQGFILFGCVTHTTKWNRCCTLWMLRPADGNMIILTISQFILSLTWHFVAQLHSTLAVNIATRCLISISGQEDWKRWHSCSQAPTQSPFTVVEKFLDTQKLSSVNVCQRERTKEKEGKRVHVWVWLYQTQNKWKLFVVVHEQTKNTT